MDYDAYGNPIKPKSSGVLLPVVLALLVSGAGNYWLWKERSKLTGELFTANSKLGATEALQKELADKVSKLETDRSELVEAKEQAIKDAQAKATELAKLKDDVAGVAGVDGAKEPEGDAKAGDKSDEKSSKADGKAAKDKDADAKSSKSKKSKSKKKAESSHKKDSGSAKPSGEL